MGSRLRRGACTSMRPSETVCEACSAPSNVWNTCSSLSGAARHQVDVAEMPRRYAEAHRTTTRRKASWVVPPFSLEATRKRNSPSGEGGGTILVRRVNPSSCAADVRTRRQLSVGLEPARWCPRTTRDVRGRDDFGEGSSSRRNGRPSEEGPHPERREALPYRMLGYGSGSCQGSSRGEGASTSDQPKRA
jgi:hypothetical protein